MRDITLADRNEPTKLHRATSTFTLQPSADRLLSTRTAHYPRLLADVLGLPGAGLEKRSTPDLFTAVCRR